MPPRILPLLAALAITEITSLTAAAVENCRTGDSDLCVSDPNCHWNFERRGCYEGAPVQEDACAAHSDQTICDADLTFGCKWNTDKKQCQAAQ